MDEDGIEIRYGGIHIRSQPVSVLIVEPNEAARAWLADTLEKAGFTAIVCPGPSAPDYTCVGVRTSGCPLASAADVVVLNMRLASDETYRGTPGWGLLAAYLEKGLRVVALIEPSDPMRLFPDASLAVVRRPATRRDLLEAIRRLTDGATSIQRRVAEHHAPWRAHR